MKFSFERIRFCSSCVHISLMNGFRASRVCYSQFTYYFSVGKVE